MNSPHVGARAWISSEDRLCPCDQESAELREHLQLRYHFARAISSKFGIPLSSALGNYTDLRRRLGFDPATPAGQSRTWLAFVGTLEEAERRGADPLQLIVDFCRSAGPPTEGNPEHRFGSFRFDNVDADRRIELHFGHIDLTRPSDIGAPSFVSVERMDESMNDLKRLFSFVRRQYPAAQEVFSPSWLFNYPALCRLFPPEFTRHMAESRREFTGGSRWGQFIDRNGRLNRQRAEQLMARLETITSIETLALAFPLARKIARAPIGCLYRFYGVEER